MADRRAHWKANQNPEHNEPGVQRPPHLDPHGPSPPFSQVIVMFEWVVKKKIQARRQFLQNWFGAYRERVGPDLYPVMRLLLPNKDRERATYGFKEAGLAKAFLHAFGLNEKSRDAQNLINWKKPGDESKATGDFPNVLFQTISQRSSVEVGKLTVEELNNLLDELSRSYRVSAKDPERKGLIENIFRTLSEKCTANEIRWVARIILKDLSIGMKENTVFSVFHPDAMDLYNSCSDLQKICYDLADPDFRLNAEEKQIRLFKPFQPMLCGRANTSQAAVKLMLTPKDSEGFIMEEKLDGERIQLHKRGNEFYFCSRKGKDYTYLYGSDIGNGSLVPFIKNAFHPQVTDLILDGEMMVWDPDIEKYLPFGNLKTHAIEKNSAAGVPHPCFKVFDVLYIRAGNGPPRILTNLTIPTRLGILKDEVSGPGDTKVRLFKEIPGRIEFALQRTGHGIEDVEQFLQQVVEERGEGLVLKKRKSGYILAGRDSRKWVKVKPEYMDSMGESVDVLVVGASWGKGHRGGRVSSLICAVRDDITKGADKTIRFHTFVRVGTGLNLEDYEWINQKRWQTFDKDSPPKWLTVSDIASEDKGDVFLEPEESFIITVKAASIILTDQYACGMTMRFPRVKDIRRDLGIDDCLTWGDLMSMAHGQKRKADEQIAEEEPVVVKKKKTGRVEMAVSARHKGAQADGVETKSTIFGGLQFHVIPFNAKGGAPTKQDIERMILANGGTYHQTTKIPGIKVVYGGTVTSPPVAAIIRKGEKDIIKAQWIGDCAQQAELKPLSKRYLFFATQETQDDSDYHDSGEEDDSPAAGPSASRIVPDEGEETEDESDDDSEQPPEDSWLLPLKDGIGARKLDHRSFVEQESDTEEESYDDEDDDSYNFGVQSLSSGDEKDASPTRDDEGLNSQTSQLQVQDEEAAPPPPEDSPAPNDVEMDETSDAQDFDPDLIFKHLVFYLDSPSNALANGLEVTTSTSIQANAEETFKDTRALIVGNGGNVTDNLEDPKLTHIVLFKKDISRRVALMRRTEKPKRRHLVLSSFVTGCLAEESLLDEDAFAP